MGNKCDVNESQRMVPFHKGQALANEFGIKFFETSAKSNANVDDVSYLFDPYSSATVYGFVYALKSKDRQLCQASEHRSKWLDGTCC